MNNGGNDQKNIINLLKDNLFQILAVLVAVINLWIVSKLAPLASDIRVLDGRVSAIEKIDPITSREFDEIIKRFDRLESRIDSCLDR